MVICAKYLGWSPCLSSLLSRLPREGLIQLPVPDYSTATAYPTQLAANRVTTIQTIDVA